VSSADPVAGSTPGANSSTRTVKTVSSIENSSENGATLLVSENEPRDTPWPVPPAPELRSTLADSLLPFQLASLEYEVPRESTPPLDVQRVYSKSYSISRS